MTRTALTSKAISAAAEAVARELPAQMTHEDIARALSVIGFRLARLDAPLALVDASCLADETITEMRRGGALK